MKSDVEVFGEVGGENYAPRLSAHRAEIMLATYWVFRFPTEAQREYAETFLQVPDAFGKLATRAETAESVWLGERAA